MLDNNAAAVIASMRKSTLLLAAPAAACVLLGLAALAALRGGAGPLLALAAIVVAVPLLALAAGGAVAARRQRRLYEGRPDLFAQQNVARSEATVAGGQAQRIGALRRTLARTLFGHPLMVGDTVRVKSLQAIRATLDANGCHEGLPFMAEMEAWCGKPATVYRVVDKVYDYGRSRQMRRIDGCVLLVGQRCDGGGHAGCEAACYLIWKAAWLEADGMPATRQAQLPSAASQPGELRCQYTELTQASRPMPAFSLRGWLGPWAVGNVTAAALFTAAVTRAFNAFQRWRGGIAYPTGSPSDGQPAPITEPLNGGDWVRVRLSHEIARSLDKNSKNRGLWFDADMLKYCGQVFRVRGRVRQIIDVNKLGMIPMKTPCITLEDVHYTGEFQGFGEQHDYLYWREAWLERVPAPASSRD